MTVNQAQNKKKNRSRSFFSTWIIRMVSFISALFLKSWVGRAIVNSGKTFNDSYVRKLFLSFKAHLRKRNGFVLKLAYVFENGFFARVGRSIVSLVTTMSVAVYGMFFATFGIACVITHFIAIYVVPSSDYDGTYRLVMGIVIAICSIPFLSSTKSVIQLFATGKTSRRITTRLFCISEEKLWNQKKRSGLAFMLLSAFFGFGIGAFTYFVNPLYILLSLLILVAVIFIFSYPEAGIIISCILLPFLQYIERVDIVMLSLVVVTGTSYIIKLIRGKRTFHMSAMGIMVILFSISMIIAGIFSPGGDSAFVNSLYNAMIILGAFFLGGNLTKNDDIRRICVKILTVSLVIIAFLQFWNLYFMNISEGVQNSLHSDYRSIIDNSGLDVTKNLKIPGLWAAMLSPLLIAECFKKKRIYAVVALLLCFVPVVLSITYFGTLEIMIALLIGVFLYLILHSSRSVINIIVISLCVALVIMLIPIVAGQFGVYDLPSFGEIVEKIFPDSGELSSYRSHIIKDTWNMLSDGNLLGIGSGVEAYKNALSPYVTPVSENADNPATSVMQLFCESGVLGVIIFLAFSVLLLKNGMKYIVKPTDRQSRSILLGMICGYMTALILGTVSCIFTDIQTRYMFWLFTGLISSQIYSGEVNGNLSDALMKNTDTEVDLIT